MDLHLSLRFNGHFPGEPGLAGVYWSKGWWRWWWQLDYWSYKSCKAPAKSSSSSTSEISCQLQISKSFWPKSEIKFQISKFTTLRLTETSPLFLTFNVSIKNHCNNGVILSLLHEIRRPYNVFLSAWKNAYLPCSMQLSPPPLSSLAPINSG